MSPVKTYEELKEVHRLVQDENIPISKLNELFDEFHFQHKPVLQPIRRRDDDINVSILRTGNSHRGQDYNYEYYSRHRLGNFRLTCNRSL